MCRISSIIVIVLINVLTSQNSEAAFGFGKCFVPPVIADFNSSAYTGLWYEIEKFPVVYELGLTCVTAEYGLVNSTYITVKNSGFNSLLKSKTTINGYATVANKDQPNYLAVTFSPFQQFKFTGPYRVWATDYVTYSVVYSCTETGFWFLTFKQETVWILSRNKILDSALVNDLKQKIKAASVDISNFQTTGQSC